MTGFLLPVRNTGKTGGVVGRKFLRGYRWAGLLHVVLNTGVMYLTILGLIYVAAYPLMSDFCVYLL